LTPTAVTVSIVWYLKLKIRLNYFISGKRRRRWRPQIERSKGRRRIKTKKSERGIHKGNGDESLTIGLKLQTKGLSF